MRYVLAALLGVLGGGLGVALATKAIPKMMSQKSLWRRIFDPNILTLEL